MAYFALMRLAYVYVYTFSFHGNRLVGSELLNAETRFPTFRFLLLVRRFRLRCTPVIRLISLAIKKDDRNTMHS